MRYVSTRGQVGSKPFLKILLEGLAADGGLYVPTEYPKVSAYDLRELHGRSYVDVAMFILAKFMTDIPHCDLDRIIKKAYSKEFFGSEEITPLLELDQGLYLLRLSNGPTLAFKDIALHLLGYLLEYALGQQEGELNVLGATSGDTGSAAEVALRGKRGLRVFMLSPLHGMSPFQACQMYTIDDPAIFNLVIDRTFDDCQRLVKEVNADD
ncbi:MAG: threonine synthase, partial [Patescibacteria group bacterium]